MTELETTVRRDGAAVMLGLSGELDISVTGRVEQELEAIEATNPETVVLDLRDLRFIDSSGLRLILEADQRARRRGRELAVVRGPEIVHRVFLIALLDRRLRFVDDPSEVGTSG